MVKRFCPECDRETGLSFRGFCEDCFRRRFALARARVTEVRVPQCRFCGKIRVQNRWLEFSEDRLRDLVSREVASDFDDLRFTVGLEPVGESAWSARASGVVKVDGQPLSFELLVPVIVGGGQCDPCMRIRSDYFEAKLQVRFSDSNDSRQQEILSKIDAFFREARKTDSLADVQSSSPVKNGFDFQIGSKKAAGGIADRLVREYAAEKTVSKKLHSWKDGRSEYRFTFLVRF